MVQTPRGTQRGTQAGARALIRKRLVCRGVVQGVGFRPAVWRLATQLGLAGWVRNDAEGATIEVQGAPIGVACFEERLAAELPPLARLAALEVEELETRAEHGFRVESSSGEARRAALTPPDAALCPACRTELEDPRNRRARHAFITCTDCGPRYSIVEALPYDRERTSMSVFALCGACAHEYGDPSARRFHAETIGCPDCGPQVEALEGARALLDLGGILALKGLGGFQLACRADFETSVARLRRRKQRAGKPLALMAADLETARALVVLRPEDEVLLQSARGPILLAPRRSSRLVAASVAPGHSDLGVMLPTTPLHVELFRGLACKVLVMTSGNRSDEPICTDDREAAERLDGIADAQVGHARRIVRRIDDSVVRTSERGHVLVRRSRGWVPEAIALPESAAEPILALGGHLQNTVCAAAGASAFPSQHVGDLDTESARAFLLEVADGLEGFLGQRARVLVADLHPDYPSTWAAEELARERGGRVLRVQHHLTHAAAVLSEHGTFPARGERAAAIVLDGTGWGTDGTAWGCEWLVLDGDLAWSRAAHGSEFTLVGGERAVREPWRIAVATLALHGLESPFALHPNVDFVGANASGAWPRACGAGRLFEAAGALLGLCAVNGYEGEAAMRLEACAARCAQAETWPEVELPADANILPQDELLAAAARRLAAGEAVERIARGLHASFASLAAALARRVFPAGLRRVALGGGCFVNRLLTRDLVAELERAGFEPLLPRELPPGDGGLACGQAVLASVSLARGLEPRQVTCPEPASCASPSR